MLEKKTIALNQELRGVMSPDEEKAFIFGCVFYEEYTNEGETPISKEKAASLSDEAIDLIILAIFHSNLDLETDRVAYDTWKVLNEEMEKRHPTPKADVGESLRQFKEKHKDLFEITPSCDNCKYLDDCPSEYQQEQPNYCENWESK